VLQKMRYQARTGTIIYQSKMHPLLKRNSEVFSACDWLAAMTARIPNAGEHLVRYYGWCSNVNRGKRRKTLEKGEESSTVEQLIKQVYEVDPLVCPRCAGPMRIIPFIEQPAMIEKTLTHLGMCSALSWSKGAASAHSPPVASLVA
jgi:hypothetical protein